MTQALKLGVLDLRGAIDHTLELAPLADALGYSRYWIAEHQPQPTPLLTVAIVAGLTDRIRVGTAGILLHYYPPHRTAHDFHFLETLYADRIDAGFCGGVTPNSRLVEDDLDGREMNSIMAAYPDRVGRLVKHLRNTRDNRAYEGSTAWAGAPPSPPQIWSLGGSVRSCDLAAKHRLNFAYALMFSNSNDHPEAALRYRERFQSEDQPPRVALAVCGVCAETDEQASEISSGLQSRFFIPRIVGSPKTCVAALQALADRYQADEIIFSDLCGDLEQRIRCYELLAGSAKLQG